MKLKQPSILCFILTFCFSANLLANCNDTLENKNAALVTANADASIVLPVGFTAVRFADSLGEARHLIVAPSGKVYVKLSAQLKGSAIYELTDANGDGRAEIKTGFGAFTGTGIGLHNGYLYASSDNDVFRFKVDAAGNVLNPKEPETVIFGLINRHQHEAKSFTFDNEGNIYVNIGAYSNSCQEKDRTKGSKGMMPCPILDSAGGIWKFSANKLNQTYSDGTRYATGLRNVVGLRWNTNTNSLFVMQHGRDGLHDLYPDMYDTKQSAELPAECMYELKQGDNCGWPYMYYDPFQKKKILSPEYGGDGKKEPTENYIAPVAAFPAHMAPNDLLFYTGSMFPEKYKNGAFIAFHGSWNRSPEPQKGYLVAFVPFKDGKPTDNWEIFADNFAGGPAYVSPGKAKHRPCGLAQGPDGALYVCDDAGGTIYKITYKAQ